MLSIVSSSPNGLTTTAIVVNSQTASSNLAVRRSSSWPGGERFTLAFELELSRRLYHCKVSRPLCPIKPLTARMNSRLIHGKMNEPRDRDRATTWEISGAPRASPAELIVTPSVS
jgi:hypothetical protein